MERKKHGNNIMKCEVLPSKSKRKSKLQNLDNPEEAITPPVKKRKKTPSKAKSKSQPCDAEPPEEDHDEFSTEPWDGETTVAVDNIFADLTSSVAADFGNDNAVIPVGAQNCVRTGSDFMMIVLEEIALEGLDGITLEALWSRVNVACRTPVTQVLREFIWNHCRQNKGLQFFRLPEKRGKLVLYNRADNLDPDMLYIDDEAQVPADVYATNAIKHDRIMGASDNFQSREDVTAVMADTSLDEALSCYGNLLVLVADQDIRSRALLTDYSVPNVFSNISHLHYVLLEKIGRSRYHGEATCGKNSLSLMLRDSKSMFYYRLQLQQHHLIENQPIVMRTKLSLSSGKLLHLQRFYNERKSKRQCVLEVLVKLVKSTKHNMLPYSEVWNLTLCNTSMLTCIKKFVKSQEFRNVFSIRMVPYRVLYPSATTAEWKRKGQVTEKLVRTISLKDPNYNVQSTVGAKDREEDGKEESFFDDRDENGQILNFPVFFIAFRFIYQAGNEGVTVTDLVRFMGIEYYTVRSLIGMLATRKYIKVIKHDIKSQRSNRYIATCFPQRSGIEEPLSSVSRAEMDEETLSFIGNALHIPKPEQSLLNVKYEMPTVDVPAEIVEQLNMMRGSTSNSEMYDNKHNFHKLGDDFSKSIEVPYEIPNCGVINLEEIDDLFMSTSKNSQTGTPTSLLADECNVFKNSLEYSCTDLVGSNPSTLTRYHEVAQLDKFYPCLIKFIFQNLELPIPKYKIILNKTNKYLRANKSEIIFSDDEDEIGVEDADSCSVQVNLEGDVVDRAQLCEDIDAAKATLLEKFESHDIENEFIFESYRTVAAATDAEERFEPDMPTMDDTMDITELEVDNGVFSMGNAPEIINSYTDCDCDIKIVVSTPTTYMTHDVSFEDDSLTERVQFRSRVIIDMVRSAKFLNFIKVAQELNASERKNGYFSRIDVKTCARLLMRLVTGGFIRALFTTLSVGHVSRVRKFVFDPFVDVHEYMRPMLETFKISFVAYAKRKIDTIKLAGSQDKLEKPKRFIRYKQMRSAIYQYGFFPKFGRCRVIHEFLFYLTRDYVGKVVHDDQLGSFPQDVKEEMSDVYNLEEEPSWKLFVPPLPAYNSYPKGWFLLADVLLRLPLSIFVKVCSLTYVIPELPELLNHPIKRHYLVRHLSIDLRDALYNNRRYIFQIYDIFCYLCYMGLVQFGEQNLRDKEHMYAYLNANAVMYDTTTSAVGYHEVESKEYPRRVFHFNTAEVVEDYWAQLWLISARSNLGQRYSILGNYITLQYVHLKPVMTESLRSVDTDAATIRDVGYVVGDGKGACCYDSSLWLHVQRNWMIQKPGSAGSASQNERTAKRIREMFREQQSRPEPIDIQDIVRKSERRHVLMRVKKSRPVAASSLALTAAAESKEKPKSTRKPTVRKIIERQNRKVMDPVDERILSQSGKTRSTFSKEEDKLLRVSAAGIEYFMGSQKRRIAASVVRDLMHSMLKHVKYKKTSSAYRRRMRVLQREVKDFTKTEAAVDVNFTGSGFIKKYFQTFSNRMAESHVHDFEVHNAFLYFVYFASKIHADKENQCQVFCDHLSAENLGKFLHDLRKPAQVSEIFFEPKSVADIEKNTIQNVVHSSLSCISSKPEWPFILLRVYGQYSEGAIRSAIRHLRAGQMISGHKSASHSIREGMILLTGVAYQLSFAYHYNQISSYPDSIYEEVSKIFRLLKSASLDRSVTINYEKFDTMQCIALMEMESVTSLDYQFEHMLQSSELNLNTTEQAELIKELTNRCMLMASSSNRQNPPEANDISNVIAKLIQNKDSGVNVNEECDVIDGLLQDFSSQEDDALAERSENETGDVEDLANGGAGKSKAKFEDVCVDWRNKTLFKLQNLLMKGMFPELDDDDVLDKLQTHFLLKYPNASISPPEQFVADIKLPEGGTIYEAILTQIEKSCILRPIQISKVNLQDHFDNDDVVIIESLLDFLDEKTNIGASLNDCYEFFRGFTTNLEFEAVVNKLGELQLAIQVGVMNIHLVHGKYIKDWSIPLDVSKSESKFVSENQTGHRVVLSAWIKVDGTIHTESLCNWVSVILSYCVSNPFIPLKDISERFTFIKPADILAVIKILKVLQCLSLYTYNTKNSGASLLSEYSYIAKVPAPFHANIASIYVETTSTAMIKLGPFLETAKKRLVK